MTEGWSRWDRWIGCCRTRAPRSPASSSTPCWNRNWPAQPGEGEPMTEVRTNPTIPELRAGIDCGDLNPVDLVRSALARITHTEDKIEAFAAVFADEALAVAQQQQDTCTTQGPLCGIPVVVKDIY